jgi:hypothetical protein
MTPQYAIADCDWPLNCAFAAGVDVYPERAKCYESFTLNALSLGGVPRIFARVMTGRKPTSHTATRSAFAVRVRSLRTISAAPHFSAQNVLFLTVN